ncbi:hypothetical protein yc1106_01206 [Curvularia clavata]|uniref:Uncharacterized protein n=1 Tax=Curvularia clavata TaxID=95742 RepID=A0A9Q8Z0Q2_CURCL|nr:hypothetical protein yc1106_01206 [Curvularia clavata]
MSYPTTPLSPSRTIPCTPSPTTPISPSHITLSATSHNAPSASSQTVPSTPSSIPPRIQAVLASLSIIKHSLSARLLIHSLTIHNGRFCLACFRRHRNPGSCGPTCALLRPGGRNNSYRPAEASVRAAALRRDYAAYSRIVRDMHAYRGRRVAEVVLKGWEEAVKVLTRESETLTENSDRLGWEEIEARKKWEHFGGWEFEGAWGKGDKEEEETVSPEVLVKGRMGKKERRKRKIRARSTSL